VRGKLNAVKFWSEFHRQRSSKEFSTKWKSYLDKIQLKKRAYILQHLALKQVLLDNFQVSPQLAEPCKAIAPTYEEENAVRYMGGYVVRILKEKDVDMDVLIDNEKKCMEGMGQTG